MCAEFKSFEQMWSHVFVPNSFILLQQLRLKKLTAKRSQSLSSVAHSLPGELYVNEAVFSFSKFLMQSR